MFNFIGFLFSLLKGIYSTCAIHTQVNRQASVARILFAGFFGIFSSSVNKILLDAQIKEYNTKITTRQNTYDEEHNNVDTQPTAPQLPPLPNNHPLSLVPRNFRNLAITHNPNFRLNTSQSPIQHIMTQQSQDDNTYEQIIEQPHTTAFQSQNNNFFSTQVNRQASVARILFAGFFGIFSSSVNKILLDAQIKEYNTKISTRPNTYNEEHNNVDTTHTAPQIPTLPQNHPLSLVPRNFRNLAITHNPNFRPNTTQIPIQHIMTHHSQNENTYEQTIEQPHTTTFQSQNNHFLAHDEPTTWIPPSLKFPPSQPPNSTSNHTTFCFPTTRFSDY